MRRTLHAAAYWCVLWMIVPVFAFSQTAMLASKHTGDKYIITIKNHNPGMKQHVLYAADGSLKMGQYLLGTDADWKATLPASCVIVTIAHEGDWHEKRRRDFIPSDAGGHSDADFGRAKQFYLFLKHELLPFINGRIPNSAGRSFVGHSFSGLFSLYASLQPDKLFDRYYAISPSIWANYYELGKVEQQVFQAGRKPEGKIFLYAGSLEIFNKVLSSTIDYYRLMQSRNYPGLQIKFTEINNANHFSVIKPALDRILVSVSN